jgi:anti-sigma B factor antagonist
MKFNVQDKKGIVFITLEGDMVGCPTATQLAEKFHDLIADGKNRIVVDMARVDYMNSSGLGILIGGLTTIRHSGGQLRLLRLAPKLVELLRITKLDRVFDIYESEEEVIDSFT